MKNVTLKEVVGVALLGTVATSTSVANESDLTTNEQQVANVETSELADEQWVVDVDTRKPCENCGGEKKQDCWVKFGKCDSLGWCLIDGSHSKPSDPCNGTDTDMRITPSDSEVTIEVGEKLPEFNVTGCGTPADKLLVNFNGVSLEESSNIVFDRPGDHEITVEDNAGQKAVVKVHVVKGPINLATLASFTAEAVDGKVILNWITATEIDNAGFLVWRGQSLTGQCSDNPDDYTDVQQVGSWINSESQYGMSGASYSYEDTGMVPGTTYYYALEDIDDNGNSTFHMGHIISVTVE